MKPQNQEYRVKGQIFPTWAVSEAKQILATHLAPLGPKIGSVSFPSANICQALGTPLPLSPDLEDGMLKTRLEDALWALTLDF